MIRRTGTRGGFTLIEMVSVILIMAILIGVVSTGLKSARENVWRTRARDTSRQLVDAWNLFLLDQRCFPDRKELLVGKVHGDVSKMPVGIPVTIKALKPLRYEIESMDPLRYACDRRGKPKERSSKYIELSFEEAYERKAGTREDEMAGVGGGDTKKGDKEVAMRDRWGHPFYFELDFDFDGFTEVPDFIRVGQLSDSGDNKDKEKEKNTRAKAKANAVAWSMGPPTHTPGKKWAGAWK